MRVIGLDVSRSVGEIAYLENGLLRAGGRVGLQRDELERFAAKLKPDGHVVLEAPGNTIAIANVLRVHVGRVIVANPLQVRPIAEARVKTDKIDTAILNSYTRGFLPEVSRSGFPTRPRKRCGGRCRAAPRSNSERPAAQAADHHRHQHHCGDRVDLGHRRYRYLSRADCAEDP